MKLEQILNDSDFEGLGKHVAEALKRQSDAAKERYANLLVNVLQQSEDVLRNFVQRLRTLRQQEKLLKSELEKVNEAVEHLKATGNPLPFFKATGNYDAANTFCQQLGVAVPTGDDKLWNISE